MANGLTTYSKEEAQETRKRLIAEGWENAQILWTGKGETYKVIPIGKQRTAEPIKVMLAEPEAREKKEPAPESAREELAREDREKLAKEQKELAKEQRAALKAARALEPTVQSIRLRPTPIRIPIQVSAKTAGAIHMKEQRSLKDAAHTLEDLTVKYVKRDRVLNLKYVQSLINKFGSTKDLEDLRAKYAKGDKGLNLDQDQVQSLINEHGSEKDKKAWIRARKTIEEEGQMGYKKRAFIAVASRAGEVGMGTAGYLHKEISKSLPGIKHKIDVVAGMKKAIPRAIPGAHTAFGAGSELPPGISQFGAARIAQAPVSRMIGAAPTGAIKAEPTSRITITTEVPKIVAIPKEQGIGFVLGDLGKLREKE